MKAIGLTCGIGSLLVGARQAGFDVLGNIEWRKYYAVKDERGRSTFGENFPGAIYRESVSGLTPQEIERLMNPTLALGHPECGGYSALSGANKNFRDRWNDPGDIPLFTELVANFKPRFFVMDDLPKSLIAYPMEKYAQRLPEYDLFPEWISNWGYGNVQKGRNRFFVLGALKSERWVFKPGEVPNPLTVRELLEDLPAPRAGSNVPNHDPCFLEDDCFRALNLGHYRKKNTWGEVREYFRDKPGGWTLRYVREDGSIVNRIGFLKGHWDKHAHVLTGQNASLHHIRCEPYTIRERARIQGFPDDFVFYGTILNDRGEWNHDANLPMVRQTGKAMPVQFARYVSTQIAAHVRGEEFVSSGKRVLKPDEHIDAAKQWYCQSVGYADQDAACDACWLYQRCSIRTDKYGIGMRTTTPHPVVSAVVDDDTSTPAEQVAGTEPHAPASVPAAPRRRRTTVLAPSVPMQITTFGGK